MESKIKITGNDWSDLEFALEEVFRLLKQKYLGGADSNDTGSYAFQVTGEPVESEDDE